MQAVVVDDAGGSEDIRLLLRDLCVGLGLCLSLDDQARIATTDWTTAEDLTEAVFRAEGMPSPVDRGLWRAVNERVSETLARTGREHGKTEVVEADRDPRSRRSGASFRWRERPN